MQTLALQPVRIIESPSQAPVPGAVRLHNGIVLEGQCSMTTSFVPEKGDERVTQRSIDQGFRVYYVARRRSDPVVRDPQVLPSLTFRIPRKSGRSRMPAAIGVPQMSPFDSSGQAVAELRVSGQNPESIQLAISSIDQNMVEVTSQSHAWKFGMSMAVIPDAILYPGLLEQAVGFEDGDVRLNMAGMLTRAGKITAARRLLDNVRESFPELESAIDHADEVLRQKFASSVLQELQRKQQAGQHARAAAYARLFPQQDLTAAAQVAVRDLTADYLELKRRVDEAASALMVSVGRIEDQERQQQAREMVTALRHELDTHNVERLEAWEFLLEDDGLDAESKVALAATGWMLGSDNALQNFTESYGLFLIRQKIAEFIETESSDGIARSTLIEQIQQQEGYSVERTAALIRHLQSPVPLPVEPQADGTRRFRITADQDGFNGIGRFPTDYSDNRPYPLLIAVPRQGVSLQDTLVWWSQQAERFGYILVVPQVLDQHSEEYSADAEQHRRMLKFVRRIKMGLHVDDDRVFIAGHGVGGEVAMDMASSHPDLFAGVVSIAGLGRRHIQWSAHNSADLGWYIVLGERQPYWYVRLQLLLKKLLGRISAYKQNCNMVMVRYPDRGFESFYEESPAIFEWMEVTKRNPWPDTISADFMRTTDLSWHWVQFDSLEPEFAALENPTTFRDGVGRTGSVSARILPGNGFHIRVRPSSGSILLSPEIPGIDVGKEVTVRAGTTSIQVPFEPSVRDLLEHYDTTGERVRQCHMRIPFGQ
jgi:pimeloyl-ACP methyl ester carboxylesterase